MRQMCPERREERDVVAAGVDHPHDESIPGVQAVHRDAIDLTVDKLAGRGPTTRVPLVLPIDDTLIQLDARIAALLAPAAGVKARCLGRGPALAKDLNPWPLG